MQLLLLQLFDLTNLSASNFWCLPIFWVFFNLGPPRTPQGPPRWSRPVPDSLRVYILSYYETFVSATFDFSHSFYALFVPPRRNHDAPFRENAKMQSIAPKPFKLSKFGEEWPFGIQIGVTEHVLLYVWPSKMALTQILHRWLWEPTVHSPSEFIPN